MHQDYWDMPYKQRDECPRDISPERHLYDRQRDRRTNQNSGEYEPQFPSYEIYPQPEYSQKPERRAESYQEKKFDYRYDNRYHRVANDESKYHSPYEWKPAGTEPVHYGHEYDDLQPGHHDEIKPAGRANKYNTRITDLLTSIREPDFKDESFNKLVEANKGYILMVRFKPIDLAEVITAVQGSVSTLTAHGGYCIGFSEPKYMRIITPSHQAIADNSWWDPASIRHPRFPQEDRDRRARYQFDDGPSRYARNNYARHEWQQRHARYDRRSRYDYDDEPDSARGDSKSTYAVVCFWFKDYIQARDWFQSGNVRFKQPEFPGSSPYQVVAVPLTYGMDPVPFTPDTDGITLLWSEYPAIHERYHHDFFSNYSVHERNLMKRYGGNPYVSVCKYVAGDIPSLNKFGSPGYARWEREYERVGRSWRGSWIAPNSIVTISTFPSLERIANFYADRQYKEVRQQLPRYTEPFTVAITLRKVQGTSRR